MCKKINGLTPVNEIKAVMVSRLLTRENQDRLLEWAYLACVAENSVRKMYDSKLASDGLLTRPSGITPAGDI